MLKYIFVLESLTSMCICAASPLPWGCFNHDPNPRGPVSVVPVIPAVIPDVDIGAVVVVHLQVAVLFLRVSLWRSLSFHEGLETGSFLCGGTELVSRALGDTSVLTRVKIIECNRLFGWHGW